MNSTRYSWTSTTGSVMSAMMNLYGLDRTTVNILEKSVLKAQMELLQGLLDVVQHRLAQSQRHSRPEKIELD